MAKFGKWIGAGLGAFAAGPIGAIIGFIVGSAFDGGSQSINQGQQRLYSSSKTSRRPTTGGYAMSLLVLAAAIMKADGKTMKSELNYVRAFFAQNFGDDSANEAMVMLRDLLKQNIPIYDVCSQIRSNMEHSSRLQLLHFLFGIAQADGEIHKAELTLIAQIGVRLGISSADYESIKSMFIKNTDSAYKILEISPDASDEDIKKAYRKMALKYHPDKVSYLGEEFQHAAKEKFQSVKEAYDNIKKQRNIS
ncbi:MAG TPA: TerB family tellurite resistance protein [Prolixibacteraceae bacterium]|nr:TerB family tellurite resistance protein [Prolixibacteraceae bacterium]